MRVSLQHAKRLKVCMTAVTLFMTSFLTSDVFADPNYKRALKRASYLLNAKVPTDDDFSSYSSSESAYRQGIRDFVNNEEFYDSIMRYHERLFGIGLPTEYLDEVIRNDLDNKATKFAKINCDTENGRLICYWSSADQRSKVSSCPKSWEKATTPFWYPGIVAWVCPSVLDVCGNDLSRCFVEYQNEDIAKNSELGTTESFDSRFSVVKSLAKQSAGLATAIVVANYPYHNVLQSGLTAVDGAIAHFYRQQHHFDLDKLNLSSELINLVETIPLTDTRFKLINLGTEYSSGGVISTFGFLRRYEKNRTRANQLYERLLCRQFTAELPRVFPQDPGNLRETPGCEGCHATLDPLADFFAAWGEGGDLYQGEQSSVDTIFNNQAGNSVYDLAEIIRNDNAFATCTVENVWQWLMGRDFYKEEADLRAGLTNYFVTTNFSFKELVYALATHSAFIEGSRSDATVGDPLEDPPLGEPPGGGEQAECEPDVSFADDIEPNIDQCTSCHNSNSGSRQDLTTEDQWRTWGSQNVSLMASGNMPPGQSGPPVIGPVYELKEKVRCWLEQQE